MPQHAIRASSLPILGRCLGMLGAAMQIDTASAVADVGTEVHRYAAELARGKVPTYDGNDAEMLFLTRQMQKIWEEKLAGRLHEPVVEARLEADLGSVSLSGHPDLYDVHGTHATVLDYKSGYNTDADVRDQLLGYAYLVCQQHPIVADLNLYAVWLREATATPWRVTRLQVVEWARQLNRRIVRWDGTDFTAGPHCQYCPRYHECPTRTVLVRSTVAELAEIDVEQVTRAELAPRLPDLWARTRMVKKQLAAFESWVKAELENGPMGDGKTELYLGEYRRRNLDARKAWPVLKAKLSEEEMESCIRIDIGKAEKAVMAKAERGQKAIVKQQLEKELEAAEALTVVHTSKLMTRKVKPDDADTDAA